MNRRLYRSVDERMLAGVAAGMAEWLDVDPSIVRLVWVVAAIGTAGMAILVYIAMAIVIPEEPYTTPGGAPRSAAADAPTTPVPPEVQASRRQRRGTRSRPQRRPRRHRLRAPVGSLARPAGAKPDAPSETLGGRPTVWGAWSAASSGRAVARSSWESC